MMPKKSNALKILTGSDYTHPERMNPAEPKAPTGHPDCPPHLDDLARGEWEFITGKLEEMGLLSSADRPSIEIYCRAYSDWREACRHVDKQGAAIEEARATQHGVTYTLKTNPWYTAANAAWDRMERMLARLGFTPAARVGLSATTEESKPVARRKRG